jgi:monoamine oxidase
LRDYLLAQFMRIFGDKAADPITLFVKDWAFDRNTATDAYHARLTFGLHTEMRGL